MHISIIAFGTRGDVQPAIALAKGLQVAGYSVRLITSANSEIWARSHGLDTAGLSVDIQTMMNSAGGQAWVENGSNPFKQLQNMKRLLADYGYPAAEEIWRATQDTDAIIGGFTTIGLGRSIAEKRGVPFLVGMLQPLLPTRHGAAVLQPFLPRATNRINLLSGIITDRALYWVVNETVNRFRREVLSLSPYTYKSYIAMEHQMPILHGFSTHVVPHASDWPANVYATGYWFLDDAVNWHPPQALSDFLEAGPPPVYSGFGSMSDRDSQTTTQMILQAIQLSGQRAIIAGGWAGLNAANVPKTVYILDSAPHSWLFPRLMGIVHHGGAGTTAASLRAGKPTFIIPHFSDQPFWGRRVYELGVGPKPIIRPKLNAHNLAQGIQQMVSDVTMQKRATALGDKIRAEDGVGLAVEAVQKILKG